MTAVIAPTRSREQRLVALARANDIRMYRAAVKRQLRAGSGQVTLFVAAPPDELLTMKVLDLLMAVPSFGRVKASRMLNELRISHTKTVGGLSSRQRGELVELLHEKAL